MKIAKIKTALTAYQMNFLFCFNGNLDQAQFMEAKNLVDSDHRNSLINIAKRLNTQLGSSISNRQSEYLALCIVNIESKDIGQAYDDLLELIWSLGIDVPDLKYTRF